MTELIRNINEPHSGLKHGLKHQDAWHDRKSWKMIFKIIFRQGKALDGHELVAGLKLPDPIKLTKSHSGLSCNYFQGTFNYTCSNSPLPVSVINAVPFST